mmetsp:Transcript_15006/g.28239  ORF Transcript_15006/g.28239 Transcript_15006/m.28239 type:complete len:289 (-) Transcript_15006:593-1459(-)
MLVIDTNTQFLDILHSFAVMPSLVVKDNDIVMLLEFLDNGGFFDGCQQEQHSNASKMSQHESPIIEFDIAEGFNGSRTHHDLTSVEVVTKIGEHECQASSCSSPSPSFKQQEPMPYLLETNCPYDIGNQSATPCSYNQQQELSCILESSDHLASFDHLISPCSSSSMLIRMHSLAGNPLPQATTSSRAPPPSTLCPHALKHKFPERYGDVEESNEEFLMRCLRQTSLDFFHQHGRRRSPADEDVNKKKIYRQHSLVGYPLDGVYLDIPLGNIISCFEEKERIKTSESV